jgi:hypothetical protein
VVRNGNWAKFGKKEMEELLDNLGDNKVLWLKILV